MQVRYALFDAYFLKFFIQICNLTEMNETSINIFINNYLTRKMSEYFLFCFSYIRTYYKSGFFK